MVNSKRVIIVHQWSGSPDEKLNVWMRKNLEKRGVSVIVPNMPDADNPKISPWVNHLGKIVGNLDKNTFFVGHSIGCQTIMRYLEGQTSKCGGVLFIAPWLHLQGIAEEPGSAKIAKPWLETPLNYANIRKNLVRLTCIFSDNDPFVPLSDKEIFETKLGAKIIVEDSKGHFTEDDGVVKSESALHEISEIIEGK